MSADESPSTSESAATTEAAAPAATSGGRPMSTGLGVVVILVLFGSAGYLGYQAFYNPAQATVVSPERSFVCSKTGRSFVYRMSVGESAPIMSPFTNERTAFPAEPCWWTTDGGRAEEPHYVILNEYLDRKGDTICPECGHIVKLHNRPPSDDTLEDWRLDHPEAGRDDIGAASVDPDADSDDANAS